MKRWIFMFFPILLINPACEKKNKESVPRDPETAEKVAVDRFSDQAAVLMKRSSNPDLPGTNEPIDFDMGDFITTSFGPDGQQVQYYNFDVQPTSPAPLYVLFREGSGTSVEGQLNIIDVLPGDEGYSDFWQVYAVTVPTGYQANTISSLARINSAGYSKEKTSILVNCPVVPYGSTAEKRYGDGSPGLHHGWYRDKVVYYFTFEEKQLSPTPAGTVPLSPIYVCFTKNPDPEDPTSGPPSGFPTDPGSLQTHNVIGTIPEDEAYSPLWLVNVYENIDFENVSDLASAKSANILMAAAMNVNCPVVFIGTK